MKSTKYVEEYCRELRFKNYSKNTIDNYASQVKIFLEHFREYNDPTRINEKQIKDWLMLAKTTNSMRHRLSALKLFYKYVIRQPMKFKYIEYPRSEQHLPLPLSRDEVIRLFGVCDNIKHKAILSLLFMCGLRVGEVLNIKFEDIDRSNMVIHIKLAKGKRDRIVPMNEEMLKLFEKYYRQYKPKVYLFNGQFGERYSERSINLFIKQLGKKANINKRLYAHIGRHTCFSNMLANGIEMAIIQKVAGHKSIKTTQLYAKVTSNIIQNTIPFFNIL